MKKGLFLWPLDGSSKIVNVDLMINPYNHYLSILTEVVEYKDF